MPEIIILSQNNYISLTLTDLTFFSLRKNEIKHKPESREPTDPDTIWLGGWGLVNIATLLYMYLNR